MRQGVKDSPEPPCIPKDCPPPPATSRAPAMRRLVAVFLTLLLLPLLAVLALVLLLLNLTNRPKRSALRHSPAEEEPACGPVSIIILNWNGKDLLAEGLPSVLEAVKYDGLPHEILVVDNGSTDGSAAFIRESFQGVEVLELGQNLGFGGGNNAGVGAARNEIVVLLNNDMIVDREFLRPLQEAFTGSTFAAACRIRHQNPGARIEETGRTGASFRRGMIDYTHRQVEGMELRRSAYPVFWAGGGASAFHRARFLELGGFHEIFAPAYVEDADLSFRAWQAGWDVLFVPGSLVFHKHRATSNRRFTQAELQLLVQRNQYLFLWRNIRSWRLLLSHCLFLPWNSYRLARDFGPGIWGSLFRAFGRLPLLLRARRRAPAKADRTDAEIFELLTRPALYFPRRGRDVPEGKGESPRAPLRVLWLTPYLPRLGQHAGAGRMYQLLIRLARHHRISLLSLTEGEEDSRHLPDLQSVCEKVVVVPFRRPWRWQPFPYEPFRTFHIPDMEHALHGILEERDFDLLQLEYTQMACYADRGFRIPTLLTKHEVDFAAWGRRLRLEPNPLRKLRWLYNYLQVLDREIALLRRVDAAICVTEPDRRELRRFSAAPPVYVVNTGVDLDFFRPDPRPRSGNRLVYVGAFRHEPNVDAMIYFCREILPRVRAAVPGAELTIVGSEPPPSILALGRIPGVEVAGSVPDIRPFMAAASVYVVPLRLGVGIRGKVLEAWGMALPVVATQVACAGLKCNSGENCMIADAAEDFAACVIEILTDPARGESLGRQGRKTAEAYYGWDAIAAQLNDLYDMWGRRPQVQVSTSP